MAKGKPRKKKTPRDASLPRFVVNEVVKDLDQLKATHENRANAHVPERINWSQALLRIPEIWGKTKGDGITVAVLDTGVDPDHPDLKDAIIGSRDFTGDGIEDRNGHGTHVAGVIAARLNRVGFVGVAPKAKLLIGKVLANNGTGAYEWIAKGIDWAVAKGADVISMSLGGSSSDGQLFTSVHNALVKGRYVICAAGNEGSLFQNSIGYPGRYGGVITVGSHDSDGNASGFSSRGGEIDFMAPGSDIWSTYKEGGYATLSG
ncbi:S8 family peptidase, partial [bacterium]|nr:S8 family peptidase [bacterium]